MSLTPRRPFRTAAASLAALSLLALAACSDSSTDTATPTSSASAPTSASAPSTSAPAPSSGGGSDEVGCDKAKGKTVGYSEPLPDPNFQQIEKIIEAQLKKYDVTLKPVNANLNPGKQISDVQTLLQGQLDVLLINPISADAVRPALDAVRAKNIPIVVQETSTGGPYFTNVTADLETAVAEGTKLIKDTVGDGKVAAITAPPLAEVLVRQNTAFDKGTADNSLNVVDKQQNAMITPQGAKAIADGYKQKYGADLKAIWTFNDTSGVGAASSVGGDFNPIIVSVNGQPEAIPLLKDGKILATWDIQQDQLAQGLAYSALQALCGKEMPKEIVVPVKKIDKSNVDSYRPLAERVNDPFKVTLVEKNGRQFING